MHIPNNTCLTMRIMAQLQQGTTKAVIPSDGHEPPCACPCHAVLGSSFLADAVDSTMATAYAEGRLFAEHGCVHSKGQILPCHDGSVALALVLPLVLLLQRSTG